VARVGWSRTDVEVAVDGARLDPAAGLGSWAAFAPASHGALMMGDTVVFEDEITPALDATLASGLEVTAIHNHFVFDRPRVFFMHIGGHGEPAALAAGVKSVWDAIRAVRARAPQPGSSFSGEPPVAGTLDTAALGAILGHEAERQGDVVKVTIAREGRAHGVPISGSMGLTTWAAFSGSDARASVDGGPDLPEFQLLRERLESQWTSLLRERVGLSREELPLLWDCDFMFGEPTAEDPHRFVLCEVNVSSVWPFPPASIPPLVAAVKARLAARRNRSPS
jgi:hypothetical protein